MTFLALSGGDTALIVLAAFWGLLVLALCVVLLGTFNVLTSTKMTIDTFREETVPLLKEVVGTVERTNRELDRVDGMIESASVIVSRVERISGLIEQATAARRQTPGQRRRSLARLRRESRRIRARDYFPPPERELAQRALDELVALVEEAVA